MNVKLTSSILVSAGLIFGVILLGAWLGNSGNAGCPDWPTCFGAWTLPQQSGAWPAYLHRALTALAGISVLANLVWAARKGQHATVRWLLVSVGMLAGQAFLGAAPMLFANPAIAGLRDGMHLPLALLIQFTVLAAWVNLWAEKSIQTGSRTPFTRLSLWTLAVTGLLLISGAWLANSPYAAACGSWPLCNGGLPQSLAEWANFSHRMIVLVAGGLVFSVLLQAWRTQRNQTAVLVSASAAATLFIAQGLMGSALVREGFPLHLQGLHVATTAGVWVALSLTVLFSSVSGQTATDVSAELVGLRGRSVRGMLKDFLLLTKPIVVALLLVTTYAGMVIGAQSWPDAGLVFWTLLGGFMAAGGSGAINQYIDRADDQLMQRTQSRPIPAGRMTPGEGLAFGVSIALGSFYVLAAYVNLLAALLSLAGIFYYVVLYSLMLKKTTVQNIVIGGGAGAIPPLVGWAAATGSLTIPSLLLFAVIFMWTPPHFWALAIVRRKDYARAGVPMLPVVRGETETRWQVFLYTVELVALTMLLPVFGLGSSIYLVAAGVMGAALLWLAYRVWKGEGNKIAWQMYRGSSMYLAFLFLALMVDRLLL